MTRPPAAEMVEAFAWFTPPFAVLLLALLWALAARRTRRRDAKYTAETTRLGERAAAARLAAWKETHRG